MFVKLTPVVVIVVRTWLLSQSEYILMDQMNPNEIIDNTTMPQNDLLNFVCVKAKMDSSPWIVECSVNSLTISNVWLNFMSFVTSSK